jgi:exosortase/archaeosortase family protein
MISLTGFIIPPPAPSLLGTTGTELFLFGLLIAGGVYHARVTGRDAKRFLAAAFAAVSLFYFLCPEDSAVQQRLGGDVMKGMATLQAEVMRAGGTPVIAKESSIVGSFELSYARGCMGLSYLGMAVLCLLVQPVSWTRRLTGIVTIAVGMTFFNLLRLIVLYFLWDRDLKTAYDVFHRLGGGLFAVGSFALYLGVLYLKSPRALVQAPAGAPARQAA